ncbi:MAG: hypothetical protein JO363_24180 [Solirubrobacterales bacterium]|nr:hypothetical protein [Solirubrobacterales bacterium]
MRHTKETFAGYWDRWLAQRKPYLEPGTWTGYEIDGRKRLLPAFGARSPGALSVDDIREFLAERAEEVDAGEVAPRTVNNTTTAISSVACSRPVRWRPRRPLPGQRCRGTPMA